MRKKNITLFNSTNEIATKCGTAVQHIFDENERIELYLTHRTK